MGLYGISGVNYGLINRMSKLNSNIAKNVKELSSGTNTPAPSDISRISSFESQVRCGSVAQKNIQDGISLIQVDETAVDELSAIAQRLKELAVNYNSDTINSDEKLYIEDEALSLVNNINKIQDNTEFNKIKLFEDKNLNIQTGANAGDNTDIQLKKLLSLGISNGESGYDVIKETIMEKIYETIMVPGKKTIMEPVKETIMVPVKKTITETITETVMTPVKKTITETVTETIMTPVKKTVTETVTENTTEKTILDSTNADRFIKNNNIQSATTSDSNLSVQNFSFNLNLPIDKHKSMSCNLQFTRLDDLSFKMTGSCTIGRNTYQVNSTANWSNATKTLTMNFNTGGVQTVKIKADSIETLSTPNQILVKASAPEYSSYGQVTNLKVTKGSLNANQLKNLILHPDGDCSISIPDNPNITMDIKGGVTTASVVKQIQKEVTKEIEVLEPQEVQREVTKEIEVMEPQEVQREVTREIEVMEPQEVERLVPKEIDTMVPQVIEKLVPKEVERLVPKNSVIKNVLNEDFLNNNVINPLNRYKNYLGIKTRELERTLSFEQEKETIYETSLSRIRDVDMAKNMLEKAKNEMLLNVTTFLFQQNLDRQREYILTLLK